MHIHLVSHRGEPEAREERPDIDRALEQNLWSLWSRFGHGPDCTLHEDTGAVWFDTPIAALPYNGVLRFSARRNVDRRIDALIAHYHRRQVPFVWFVHPSTSPSDVGERLRARGLAELEACAGMSMDLTDIPYRSDDPDGIEIREATSAPDLTAALGLMAWRWQVPPRDMPHLKALATAASFGVPGGPLRCWLAWQRGLPVAKVMVYLADGAAGIYGVVTRPEARGRRLAGLLTLDALSAARREGYRVAVLHATPMAQPLYERIGFRARATFRFFASAGTVR